MIGMAPAETKRTSLWEFQAALDFWNEAHDTERGTKLSDDEKDRLFDWVQSQGKPLTLKEARAKANGAGTGHA